MSSNLLLFVACILSSLGCLASEVPSGKEIRTYMPFTFPVDPAKIHTIPDLNIALALNRTLIERDEEKELSAGLAESWKSISPETVRLTLNSKVKWSDGKIISAEEIKQSIERSLKVHPADGRGLISILEKIVCPTQREIDFKLKSPGLTTQLLTKLADAKLGVVKIKENGQMDLSVTSGPFSMLPTSTQTQLILKRNPSENASSSKSPYVQRIIIRKPPQNMESPKVLLEDNWPNLSESTSLATPDLAQRYENQGLEIWKTPLDKLFYLQLSKRSANSEGRALIRFLRSKIQPESIVSGMSGYALTSQIFPHGYELYDPQFSCTNKVHKLPPIQYRRRPIEILMSPARVSSLVKMNLGRAIQSFTGIEPRFISVPLEEVYLYRLRGNFDLYAGAVGLAEPDLDNLLSLYIEGDIPIIFPTGTNLLNRLESIRRKKDSPEKTSEIRKMLREAQCEGNILPLFHLSTLGIARNELDFSEMSESDESIRLSKIRFKDPDALSDRRLQ